MELGIKKKTKKKQKKKKQIPKQPLQNRARKLIHARRMFAVNWRQFDVGLTH